MPVHPVLTLLCSESEFHIFVSNTNRRIHLVLSWSDILLSVASVFMVEARFNLKTESVFLFCHNPEGHNLSVHIKY
jgi:hypothetical protein